MARAVLAFLRATWPAFALVAFLAGLYGWARHEGASAERRAAALGEANTRADSAERQADLNAEDTRIAHDSAEARVIIIREASHAADDIRNAPLGSDPVVRVDDLRDLRDRVQRLRDTLAACRERRLEPGAEAGALRASETCD